MGKQNRSQYLTAWKQVGYSEERNMRANTDLSAVLIWKECLILGPFYFKYGFYDGKQAGLNAASFNLLIQVLTKYAPNMMTSGAR